jgi:GxxExxY protein
MRPRWRDEREGRREGKRGEGVDVFEFRGRGESKVDTRTEDLAARVIGAAIEVHRHLGPGLPEIPYRKALSHELDLRGVRHQCEVPVPIIYKGVHVGDGRIDMLVEDVLICELKSVEQVTDLHRSQALTYLLLKRLQLALLLNFNVTTMKEGIRRVINTV